MVPEHDPLRYCPLPQFMLLQPVHAVSSLFLTALLPAVKYWFAPHEVRLAVHAPLGARYSPSLHLSDGFVGAQHAPRLSGSSTQ